MIAHHADRRTLSGLILTGMIFSGACQRGSSAREEPPEVAASESALGGVEGTMEFAIDAPWRIEPAYNEFRQIVYGSIPIQISIHDSDLTGADGPVQFGDFCEVTVEETIPGITVRRHYDLASLEEIEAGGRWMSPVALAPPHGVCRPEGVAGACESLRNVGDQAEWHAVLWYSPRTTPTPGTDIPLTMTAMISRRGVDCSARDSRDFVLLRNHVFVHLGEAPLPRFDNRWIYGDLHYHSQGTDNEGEAAYNYRGVIRALGAMGLDFAFATEHASNSVQITDFDLDLIHLYYHVDYGALRDMSQDRFTFLLDQLHRAGGVNRSTSLDGWLDRAPQGYLSHGVAPQIFLGGEVDAIPEVSAETITGGSLTIPYGNGLSYDLRGLCEGWNAWIDLGGPCAFSSLSEPAAGGYLIRDVQGLNEFDYGREHLIYFPIRPDVTDTFVASNTGPYGGAARRLDAVHDGESALLAEMEVHGYAFAAHPLNDSGGDLGPNGPPWSDHMLQTAWRSSAILGLQFWNEPARLRTRIGEGDCVESGYEVTDGDRGSSISARSGFAAGLFELVPLYDMANRQWHDTLNEMEKKLHHGAYTWDRMLQLGLSTPETAGLSWLAPNQPRRFFVAAGSDAHGDLNYRRTGYFLGTEAITDVALGKVRNLVFAGDPTLPIDSNFPGSPAVRHSQSQVVSAIREGRFSVTNGPALRIVIDGNRNGRVDETDISMGGVFELSGETELEVLVEWASTAEFGAVTQLDLYVGVSAAALGVDGSSDLRTYAPPLHGPREGTLLGDAAVSSYVSGGYSHISMQDHYWRDPTGILRFVPATPSMAGVHRFVLPLAAFQARRDVPGDRFYVRAFARTAQKNPTNCGSLQPGIAQAAARRGECFSTYAFTNPVWAITRANATVLPGRGHE